MLFISTLRLCGVDNFRELLIKTGGFCKFSEKNAQVGLILPGIFSNGMIIIHGLHTKNQNMIH